MKKLFAVAALFAAACHTAAPVPPPLDKGEARERWFYEQRAYPFDSIPADGRRQALRQVERQRVAPDGIENAIESDAVTHSWREIGPKPVLVDWPWLAATGRVKALAVSRVNPDVVLAGSSSGGIWRSVDAGRHFAPVSDDHADLAVGAIAFAPSNPSLVYATMGSDFLGTGVLRSDDAGATWRLVSGSTYGSRGTAPQLVVHPTDPNHLWVAQFSRLNATSGATHSSGVLESTDGGVTWTRRFAGLPTDLVALPGSATTFLAGMRRVDQVGGGESGIYRSSDGGASWSPVFTISKGSGSPRIAVTPAAPQRAYAHVFSDEATGMRYRFLVSDDGGATWSVATAEGLARDFAIFVHVDPSNADVVYVGMRDLYRSLDGGETFTNVTKGYRPDEQFDPANSTSHVDQHSMAFHPQDSSTLYLGNDGGVFLSRNRGTTFESLSGTLSLVQAYGIAAHPTDPMSIFLGTQDNGLERRDPNGMWRELITGDYGSILFDKHDHAVLATNYVYGLIMAFGNRGDTYLATLSTSETFGEGPIGFIAPFEQSRVTNTLYFGTWRLFRSRNFGQTWTAPAGTLRLTKNVADTLSAIAVSESNPNVIYTGSAQGRLMITRDDGQTWKDVTAGLPDRSARAIAIDRNNSEVAYVGFSGYAAGHVYVTRDGGSFWAALPGLPDIPVNALLLREPYLYAGTDIGVFRWDGLRWESFSNGMPPVIVTDFAMTANGTIVVATHGRGAYELVTSASRRRGVRH
ncbi:MAG TPA: hypothetical protein VGQ36_11245 [Thermoanaerobaculia bacterium]|jgi:photosystem II stability/assembly factor-like uncharacterized protein|nr:hypothetical protein [Thermoanaerobaculia bacterium]